ncbi:MAG: transferrin-binding protein-like solute binding protein [Pseudomonadota bacterium]
MRTSIAFSVLSLFTVAACGGGGGGTSGAATVYNALGDTTITTPTTVQVLSLDFGTRTTQASSGSLDHANQTFMGNGMAIGIDTTGITNGLDSVAGIASGSVSAAGDIKLIAQQTASADLPTSGSFTYTGSSLVNINDAANAYDATMVATISADFSTVGADAQTVDVDLTMPTNVTQTRTNDPNNTTFSGSMTSTVTITDLEINGAGFAAGAGTSVSAVGWDGGSSNLILGNQTIDATGVFAGDNADEVAGVVGASGQDGGTLNVIFSGGQ